jgi:MFS family permease
MTLTGVVSGAILVLLIRLFRSFSPTFGIALMGIGYMLLSFTRSLSGIFIAMVCIGFSSGILMPILLLRVSKITPQISRAFAAAVVSVGIYLGQFLSPVILKGVASLSLGDSFRTQFLALSLGLGIATLIASIVGVKNIKNVRLQEEVNVGGHGSLHK